MELKANFTIPQNLPDENCLTNDVIFAHEYNPHNVRPWTIGNESGPLCLVWASCEQDALDAAVNETGLKGLAIDEAYAKELEDEFGDDAPIMLLGNAGEPFDSVYAWIHETTLTHEQQLRFAEARGAQVDNLGQL